MTTLDEPDAPAEDALDLVPIPLDPPILPRLRTVSGLYQRRRWLPWPFARGADGVEGLTPLPDGPVPVPGVPGIPGRPEIPVIPGRPFPPLDPPVLPRPGRSVVEDLRLDVDGRYPQMVASGTIRGWLVGRLHWIADLAPAGPNRWTGTIWYRDGNAALLPHSSVDIKVAGPFPWLRTATVAFTGGAPTATRTYRYESAYHHKVEFEYDCEQGQAATLSVDTHAHPNRPGTLPVENLTLETVYRRAGFDVSRSTGDNIIPSADAGGDTQWSDQEMHDAMQTYWSRFANAAQWSLWVFFARQHVQGSSLGGIMFDDIGPNHRQGTAMFNDSFVSQAPAGDAAPAAWVQRMRFWTAAHEMGHAFNLAHSWQKSLGAPYGTPWLPGLADEPEARSFMNYPYNVSGGQTAFFADFAYRFSDAELLFMRHAPERFVQMGNADWFDHHGFEQADVVAEPALELVVRANRERPEFEFLEPVMLELKLTNSTTRPQLIDTSLLRSADNMTVIVKRQGQAARQFAPFARYCLEPDTVVLHPGESHYAALPVSVGIGGWDLAEPGRYLVQVALQTGDGDVVSEPLLLRVAPPHGYDEEYLAQDVFTEKVGRVLAFDGSRVLDGANDTLHEVAERLGDRRVALHARYALGAPVAAEGKQLRIPEGASRNGSAADGRALGDVGADIVTVKAQPKAAQQDLEAALLASPAVAAETFGHIGYRRRVEAFTEVLAAEGEQQHAAQVQGTLHDTLAERGVLDRVLAELEARQAELRPRAKSRSKGTKGGSRKR
ncbi:MAG: hypothetical protein ACR2KP_00625 [Egibacteraceae bacterium]